MGKKVAVVYKTTFEFSAIIYNDPGRVYVNITVKHVDESEPSDIGMIHIGLSEWKLLKAMLNDGALLFRDGEATIQIEEHNL